MIWISLIVKLKKRKSKVGKSLPMEPKANVTSKPLREKALNSSTAAVLLVLSVLKLIVKAITVGHPVVQLLMLMLESNPQIILTSL